MFGIRKAFIEMTHAKELRIRNAWVSWFEILGGTIKISKGRKISGRR